MWDLCFFSFAFLERDSRGGENSMKRDLNAEFEIIIIIITLFILLLYNFDLRFLYVVYSVHSFFFFGFQGRVSL